MFWFWINVPLMAVFFAAWCGIPLYMVLRHSTWGPARADSAKRAPVRPRRAPEVARDVRPSTVAAGAAQ